MDPQTFARSLDSTNLKLNATEADITALCNNAAKAGFASVCVYPIFVPVCVKLLYNSTVKICTVVGFPHGSSTLGSKLEEIAIAYKQGADEVDIVINHASLRAGKNTRVYDESQRICEAAGKTTLTSKLIVETCYLNEEQKLVALDICEQAGADFIKTSTGFGSGGANLKDIKLFADNRTGSIKIKASGGIRNLKDALALISAGADRLGVSAADQLISDFENSTRKA